jgi:uncharacterized protein (UPF0548 family)
MFLLEKPSVARIQAFLDAQSDARFSYAAIGATRADAIPAGYIVDRNSVKLGVGLAVFRRACDALRQWEMFNLDWLELHRRDTPIEVGRTVAVVPRHLGFWSLNACRIVYVVDEDGSDVRRFGFAYGTLDDHAETGEERFLVEWRREDDTVWYDILAFSRPAHILSVLGWPVGRMFQMKFGRDSKRAMAQAMH